MYMHWADTSWRDTGQELAQVSLLLRRILKETHRIAHTKNDRLCSRGDGDMKTWMTETSVMSEGVRQGCSSLCG